MRRLAIAACVLLLMVGTACAADETSSGGTATPGANVFGNPGFEEGRDPWFSLSTEAWGPPFEVTQEQARTGSSSGAVHLRSSDGGTTRVYGIVQEVTPETFPTVLSGNYYVADWQQGTPKQYMQAVVIVWGAKNQPAAAGDVENYQIRYVLAGVETQPLLIANAQYVLAGTGPPETGRWVPFRLNFAEDFQRLWGAVPEGYQYLRILFEARWDERTDTDLPSSADVYYDDLYLGSRPPP